MNKIYLLDTNALFNYIKNKAIYNSLDSNLKSNVDKLESGDCYISEITTVEIISTLGKYARGGLGAEKRMNKKKVKAWLKAINQVIDANEENDFKVEIVPFNQQVIVKARIIIYSALKYKFASMDAMIAATAIDLFSNHDYEEKFLITSDTSLICALELHNIPYWDAFKL